MSIKQSIPGSLVVGDLEMNKRKGHEIRSSSTDTLRVAVLPDKDGVLALLSDVDVTSGESRRITFYVPVSDIESPEEEVQRYKDRNHKMREGDLLLAVQPVRDGTSLSTLYMYDARPRESSEEPYLIRASDGIGMWVAVSGRFHTSTESFRSSVILLDSLEFENSGFRNTLTQQELDSNTTQLIQPRNGIISLQYEQAEVGEDIEAGRAVWMDSSGILFKWDPDTDSSHRVVGVTIEAKSTGETANFSISGRAVIIGSSFTPGIHYYVGADGILTSSEVGLSVITEIGLAISPEILSISIKLPVIITP